MLFSLCLVSLAVQAGARTLSAREIRQHLAGMTLTDGIHWSYTLNTDGSLAAIDLGKTLAGIWRISGAELCVRVPITAAEDCWQVRMQGTHMLLVREGGMPIEVSAAPATTPTLPPAPRPRPAAAQTPPEGL